MQLGRFARVRLHPVLVRDELLAEEPGLCELVEVSYSAAARPPAHTIMA